MRRWSLTILALLLTALVLGACGPDANEVAQLQDQVYELADKVTRLESEALVKGTETSETDGGDGQPAAGAELGEPDVSYTLSTGQEGDALVFIGKGGEIDGEANPTLTANPGDVVEIKLVNGMATEHDLNIEELGISTGSVLKQGDEKTIKFKVDEASTLTYFCSVPGHRQAGMEGQIQIGEGGEQASAEGENIIRNPASLPAPLDSRGPELVEVNLTAEEVVGQLANGTTYHYFTFNGTVPGPFIRVRVGDTVQLSLTNETTSTLSHSIDLHAVTGPGGGAVFTATEPGQTTTFTFQALKPGIYVYHCATPSVAHHITSGMYGMILVEPEGGLPPVDREYYVMQGEIYTVEPYGTKGELQFSEEKMLNETPEYFVFNGAAGALTQDSYALTANVGETVRIFFGVGGPNFSSSFHIIGEIFDRVYPFGSFTSPPLTDVQTINVNPGSAWVVEFTVEVPGRYILVDHALSRLERGLIGFLYVAGIDVPEIFKEGPAGQ